MTKLEKLTKAIAKVAFKPAGFLLHYSRSERHSSSRSLKKGDRIHIDLPSGLRLSMQSHCPSNGGLVYIITVN